MEASSHHLCWFPDDLQGVANSRSFSRMVGLLDRQTSSYRFGVNFSKPGQTQNNLYNYKGHFGPTDVFHNATLGQLSTLKN